MTIIFRSSYGIAFSTLCFILLTASTLLAKPIAQNIADYEIDPQSYMRMYGYLEEEDTRKVASLSVSSTNTNDSFVSAIKNFQRFMGLNVTGVQDEATKRQMSRPRCGVKDTPKSLRQNQIAGDYSNSRAWNKILLTYRFGSFASYDQISRPLQESILDDAFYEWSKHVPLTFDKVCETCPADIVIEFIDDELGNHRDYHYNTRFERGVVAHATFPGDIYPAFIHFNKKVKFTDRYDSGTSEMNLFHTAVHEIGHTLGLDHIEAEKNSIMFSHYPDPYDRSRANYLESVDQELLQAKYGRREKSVVSSCSTWSASPERLSITITDLKNPQSISLNQGDKAVETGNNHQLLTSFLLEHRQRYHNVSDHLRQQKNASKSFGANRGRTITRSMLQVNRFKTSGTLSENEFGQMQAIFIHGFDDLYASDYFNNRVLKYDAVTTAHQKTIVAENLSAPRALYVTNDGSTLYIIDSKGVHRFKLDEEQRNLGTSTLLFCMDSSSEIYSMIVDEDDFNTIYLYDSSRQRIQQCRHLPDNWQCETIVNLTAITRGLTRSAYMVLDPKGDLSIADSTSSVVLHYKHDKNGCKSVSTSIGPPLYTTESPSSSSTTIRTVNEQKPTNNGITVVDRTKVIFSNVSVVGNPLTECLVNSDDILEIITNSSEGGCAIPFEQLYLPITQSLSNQILEFDMEFLITPSGDVGRHGGIYYGDHQLSRGTPGSVVVDWLDRIIDRGYRFYTTDSPWHSSNVLLPGNKEPTSKLKIIIKSNCDHIVVAGNYIMRNLNNGCAVQLQDKPYLGFWAWGENHLRISNFTIRPYTGCELD